MIDVEFISELAIADLHGLQNKKSNLDKYYVLYEREFEQRSEVKRIFRLVLAGIAFGTYVWFAAVRYVPLVKARKRRRRASFTGS